METEDDNWHIEKSYHVVEASKEGDVGETHQLRIVNAKTEKKTNYNSVLGIIFYLHLDRVSLIIIFINSNLNGSTM